MVGKTPWVALRAVSLLSADTQAEVSQETCAGQVKQLPYIMGPGKEAAAPVKRPQEERHGRNDSLPRILGSKFV